jgi:hypothetical protein
MDELQDNNVNGKLIISTSREGPIECSFGSSGLEDIICLQVSICQGSRFSLSLGSI